MNFTDEKGNKIYNDSGLSPEMLQSFARTYNVTISLDDPTESFERISTVEILEGLIKNKIDFLVHVPWLAIPASYTDLATDPIIFESLLAEIPCLRSTTRIKGVDVVGIRLRNICFNTGNTV